MLKSGINRDGKTYFPVTELAGEFGYAVDHISRLCRQGKVDAFQEQNAHWYATRESILEHRDLTGKIKRRIALSNLGLGEQNRPPVLSTSSFRTADRASEKILHGTPFRLSPKLAWQEFIFRARKTWADRANLRPAVLIAAKGFRAGFRYALLALFVLAVSSLTSAISKEARPIFDDIGRITSSTRALADNILDGTKDTAGVLTHDINNLTNSALTVIGARAGSLASNIISDLEVISYRLKRYLASILPDVVNKTSTIANSEFLYGVQGAQIVNITYPTLVFNRANNQIPIPAPKRLLAPERSRPIPPLVLTPPNTLSFEAAAQNIKLVTLGFARLFDHLFIRLPLAAGESFGKNFVAVSNVSSLSRYNIPTILSFLFRYS